MECGARKEMTQSSERGWKDVTELQMVMVKKKRGMGKNREMWQSLLVLI